MKTMSKEVFLFFTFFKPKMYFNVTLLTALKALKTLIFMPLLNECVENFRQNFD